MATRLHEVETDPVSGCPDGRSFLVSSTTSTAADTVHAMTDATAVDAVWLAATNNTSSSVVLNLVLNPVDDTNAANVAAALSSVSIRANSTVYVLEGERFRDSTGAYVVGAYVGAGDDDKISLRGWYVRRIQPDVTA